MAVEEGDLVTQLMMLTDCQDRNTATFALESCGYDIAAAVAVVFEMGSLPIVSHTSTSSNSNDFYGDGIMGIMSGGGGMGIDEMRGLRRTGSDADIYDEDGVRRPDNVKRQRLLGDPIVGPLEYLHDPSLPPLALSAPKSAFSSSSNYVPKHEKERTLQKMYTTPRNLVCTGSLEDARDVCKCSTPPKWLLVNIQRESEWSCQILTREVWNNEDIQELVRTSFCLWQEPDSSSAGKLFVDRYKVFVFPYIAILDPRTAAVICHWNKKAAAMEDIYAWLLDFLSEKQFPGGADNKNLHRDVAVPSACVSLDDSTDSDIIILDGPPAPAASREIVKTSGDEIAVLDNSSSHEQATEVVSKYAERGFSVLHVLAHSRNSKTADTAAADTGDTQARKLKFKLEFASSKMSIELAESFCLMDLLCEVARFVGSKLPASSNDQHFDLVFGHPARRLSEKLDALRGEGGVDLLQIPLCSPGLPESGELLRVELHGK